MIRFLIVAFIIALPFSAKCSAAELKPIVIANQGVDVQQLSHAQLRSIYMMRQVLWPNGQAIKGFVLPARSDLHLQFTRQKLQLFPYQLDRVWQKLTFSGTGTPPTEVADPATMRALVASTPGAIGYIESTDEITPLQIIAINP